MTKTFKSKKPSESQKTVKMQKEIIRRLRIQNKKLIEQVTKLK